MNITDFMCGTISSRSRRRSARSPWMVWGAAAGLTAAMAGCRPSGPPTGSGAAAPTARTAAIQFEDVSERVGIRFKHNNGADGRMLMPESVGPGGAFLDFDGDGRLDILLVNGTHWPDKPGPGTFPALYRQQPDGTFRDVTAAAGLRVPLFGMGCAVADYDGDGKPDLLITCVGQNHLFHNEGGKFQDVTARSGLTGGAPWDWHTSAAWLDYDHDGQLDLYVCRYVQWSPKTDVPCHAGSGKRTYCGPNQYLGTRGLLYHNLGGGRFQDVSAATGIASAGGKGLGVLPVDEDGDGWTDLFVTNDLVPNLLFHNEGGRRFKEMGQEMGVAVSTAGTPRAGMGTDLADVRNDGALSLAVGNFSSEGLALFDRGAGLYTDIAGQAGLVPASLERLTFGLLFLDADRDGWTDLFAYNGHVDPQIQEKNPRIGYKEAPQLFRNSHGQFVDVTATAGPALQQPQVGRGCAWGDFDNDGRPDLLLCENNGPARLLRNTTPDSHHWLGVRLLGKSPNRDGFGALVTLTAGGTRQRRWIHSGGSYLAQSDTRALFGLADTAQVQSVEVRWPGGKISTSTPTTVDRYLDVSEP